MYVKGGVVLNEIWKDIKGYEGLYQVSNLGNVRTVKHISINSKGHSYTVKPRILKLHTYPNGYKDVMLQHQGRHRRYLVHKLVAIAFIPNPNNLPEVNHKDESRDNNCVDNLEWCTRKYNCNYGGCIERQRKAKQGKKLSEEHKHKISEKLKGRPSPNKGNKFSLESRNKLSLAHKGKTVSQITRQRMSEARKLYWERKKHNEL